MSKTLFMQSTTNSQIPHTRYNVYEIVRGCTCDSKEDTRTENLRWCITPGNHVCVCEPEPFNFSNTQCRAKVHQCVCHVINRHSLGGTNYDHAGMDFIGDTFGDCQAAQHRCFCHLGYLGGCPAHPHANNNG